jgi:hypothetical protein
MVNSTSDNSLRVGTLSSTGGVTIQATKITPSGTKTNLLFNPDGGSVGIGVISASSRLDIKSPTVSAYAMQVIKSSNTNHIFSIYEESDGDGSLLLRDAAGSATVYIQSGGVTYFKGGNFGVGTANPSQTLEVAGNVAVSGSVSKGSGSFDIKHPDPSKSDFRLRHYFVETPSAGGNLYKYTKELTKGENCLDLPEYFKYLNTNSTVFISPNGCFGQGYGLVESNTCLITVSTIGSYNIFIFADRKDELAVTEFNKYGIEYEK